jgi:glycosyltransferase involved in cell wall biosynthesis
MKCSICIPTYQKAPYLLRTLDSIFDQDLPVGTEVIVVDDGSTDNTSLMLDGYQRDHLNLSVDRLLPKKHWRNVSCAGNIALRQATGDIVIWQTDDIVHESPTTIKQMCDALKPGAFVLAACQNVNAAGVPVEAGLPGGWFCHSVIRPGCMHPFLAAFWRADLFAIGGWDERFTTYGFDDDWLEACLTRGLGLKPDWHDEIICYHQDHPTAARGTWDQSLALYRRLIAEGVFHTETAPWQL